MSEEVWEFARNLLKEKKEKLDVVEGEIIAFDDKEALAQKLRDEIEELEEMIP